MVRGLDQVLRGIGEHVITFVDDIFITSKSKSTEQHLQHLEELLERLEDCGITLNLEKSHFFIEETRFLGFRLKTEGIKPDPEKLTRSL